MVKAKNTKINLCDYCNKNIPECLDDNNIIFGNDIGNDNIIGCSQMDIDENKRDDFKNVTIY